MSFKESNLENLIIEAIESKGYIYSHGNTLTRQYDDVLLEDDIKAFLKTKYCVNGITDSEIDRAILSLKAISATPSYSANRTTFVKMVDGYIFVRDDRTQKDFLLQMFDFDDVSNNIFRVCNQVIIKGPKEKRIIDTLVYVNGIPLVLWEDKSAIREKASIYDAYKQVTTRYVRDIPELFKYNAFVVITDGVNTKIGSAYTPYKHFHPWRRVSENDKPVDGAKSLFATIDGLFNKERLIDFIYNFIYFPDDSVTKDIKIVASCHQYFAANKLYRNILMNKKPKGDGKGGTYFGTAGCGKSYAMLFLTRLLMHSKELNSPTVVLITDRKDLDDQLSNNFVISKRFLNEENVSCISTREELKDVLQGKASGGIHLTMIQKFTEEINVLSERDNIICISDEAHRTQLNLDQKVTIKGDEIVISYGFAKYLHDSFPNATYVGFTATPIDDTIDVFGPVVDSYTMKDGINDGVIVPIIYDGRFAPVVLGQEQLKKIEDYYEECRLKGANEYQIEESQKTAIGFDAILGHPSVIKLIAECIVEDYETRVREGATVVGACMIPAYNREIAFKLYKAIAKIRPDWIVPKRCADGVVLTKEEKLKLKTLPKLQMVMTRNKDDEPELYNLLGTDDDRKDMAIQFKEVKSNFKIVIVADMWMTGFDVPFLDLIYNVKPVSQMHSIIQRMMRGNRAYEGKEHCMFIDFVGIKPIIDMSLKQYGDANDAGVEGIEHAVLVVKDELDIINRMLHTIDNSKYLTGTNLEKFECLNKTVEFVQQSENFERRFMAHTKRMRKAFKICCNFVGEFTKDEIELIHFYMAIRSYIFKLTRGNAPDVAEMNQHVQMLVEGAIQSSKIEDLFAKVKEDGSSGIELFSEEYMEKIKEIEFPNTRAKILMQLAKGAIEEYKKINKIKAMSFSERLQLIVDTYNFRSIDPEDFKRMLNDIAKEAIGLLEDIKKESESFKALGINYEEKAFYDILVAVEKKHNVTYPEEKNIELAQEIHKLVTNKAKYTDWSNRADIKASLQVDIIKLLYKYKFPSSQKTTELPEEYEAIYNDVITQAENFKKYYDM